MSVTGRIGLAVLSLFIIVWWVLGITHFEIPVWALVVVGIIAIPTGLAGLKVSLTGKL